MILWFGIITAKRMEDNAGARRASYNSIIVIQYEDEEVSIIQDKMKKKWNRKMELFQLIFFLTGLSRIWRYLYTFNFENMNILFLFLCSPPEHFTISFERTFRPTIRNLHIFVQA